MKILLCTVLVLIGLVDILKASELPAHPLTYSHWKRLQVHKARTDVVSASEQIQAMHRGLNDKEQPVSDHKLMALKLSELENQQKSNLEKLQYSKELTFEEYFDVYLKNYSQDPVALEYIAKRMSKASVALLLKRSMQEAAQEIKTDQAERNSASKQ